MQAEALVFTEADLRRLVVSQLEEIQALREELGTLREEVALERALDRQRIARLEKTRA